LVVDDNASSRRILAEMLRGWGSLPTLVPGAEQAVARADEARQSGQPFALALADSRMPGRDGLSLAAEIMTGGDPPAAVLVMLTTDDLPHDIGRCEQLGLTHRVLKPIGPRELLDAIAKALGHTPVGAAGVGVASVGQSSDLRPLRVLLAEDSLVNQKLVVTLMEKQGHSVTVADNGKEAVAALARDEFDLVLMDVMMPEMDGFEATRTIRAREQETGGHTPILAMTAHAMKGDRERCLEAGMDGYVSKPIAVDELFGAVRSVVPGGGPSHEDTAAAVAPRAAPAEGNDQPDWASILARFGGNQELLEEVIEAFLDESPRLLTEARLAVERGDPSGLKRAAHTLRGASRHFGVTAAHEHAAELEAIAERGDLGGAADGVQRLDQDVMRLHTALAEFLRSRTGRPDNV
jgi:CheY-like chemotaxis protein